MASLPLGTHQRRPYEDTKRRVLSAGQAEKPPQNPTTPAPSSQSSCLQDYEKIPFCHSSQTVYDILLCSPNRLRQLVILILLKGSTMSHSCPGLSGVGAQNQYGWEDTVHTFRFPDSQKPINDNVGRHLSNADRPHN